MKTRIGDFECDTIIGRNHKGVRAKLNAEFYFAKPYRSRERGLNEHTNGLVKQYLPKKTDLSKVTDEEVKRIENSLNNRPRKSLNFKMPICGTS